MDTILTPTDSYLMDTRDPNSKFVQNLASDVKGLKENPMNSPVVPNLNLELQTANSFPRLPLAPQIQLNSENGFYTTSFFQNRLNLLPKPNQFKTNLINEINLSISLYAFAVNLSGYIPPVGATDFSLTFYLSLWLFDAEAGNINSLFGLSLSSTFIDTRLMCIPFVFNFLASEPTSFTITDPTRSYQLSDIIVRGGATDFPDFTTNPTKITTTQYNFLKNRDSLLANMFGYDFAEYNSLSTDNKTVVYDMFGDPLFYDPYTGIGQATFGIGINAVFSYFGITASYTPKN
jgi:hypothetical protein